jgi:hypothetical protein
MKTFGINCQLQNKLFLIIIHRFSLVKAATNANCTLCNGVIKTPLNIAIAHLSLAEGLSFQSLDKCIYDCKLRNEKRLLQVRNEFSPPTSKLVA